MRVRVLVLGLAIILGATTQKSDLSSAKAKDGNEVQDLPADKEIQHGQIVADLDVNRKKKPGKKPGRKIGRRQCRRKRRKCRKRPHNKSKPGSSCSNNNTSTELPSLPRSYCQPGESCWPNGTDIADIITLIEGNQLSCLGLKKFVHFGDPDAHIRRCLPYNGLSPEHDCADLTGNHKPPNPTCNSNPFVTDAYYNDTDNMYACMTPYQFLNNRNYVKEWMAAFIVTASKTDDVINAIKFARKHSLGISVMGTGHEFLDRNAGPAPNSLLIRTACLTDWYPFPDFEFDDYNGTKWKDGYVVLGPGHTFGRNFWWNITNSEGIYALAAKVTREMVGGTCHSVGIVGWTIGGGRGWIAPMFGIGVNQVLHVDLITAEGNPISANYTHNTDLFWAIRGGGAGFGVITSMILKLHKPKCRTKTGDITMADCYTVWNVTYEGEYKGINTTVPYVKHLLTKYSNWSINLRSSWTSALNLQYIKHTNKYRIEIEGRYFAKKGEKPCTYNSFIDTFNDTRDRKGNINKVTTDKYWCDYFPDANNGNNCTTIRYYLERLIENSGSFVFLVNSSIQHNDFISELLYNTWQPLCEKNPYSPCALGYKFRGDLAAIDEKTGRGVYATPSAVSNGFNSASFNIWALDIISKKVNLTFDQKLSFMHFNLATKLYKYSNSSYFNEAEYTMSPGQWERRFWGKEHFSKLVQIKKKYDPELFLSCHHCIGNEVVIKSDPNEGSETSNEQKNKKITNMDSSTFGEPIINYNCSRLKNVQMANYKCRSSLWLKCGERLLKVAEYCKNNVKCFKQFLKIEDKSCWFCVQKAICNILKKYSYGPVEPTTTDEVSSLSESKEFKLEPKN